MSELTDVAEPPTHPDGLDEEEIVELVVPARTEHLRVLRLAAVAVASTVAFGLDALEELRIAVDEAAAVAIDEATPRSHLSMTISGRAGTVTVAGRVPTDSKTDPEMHMVARELLNLSADAYSIKTVDGHIEFHLVKHGETNRHDG